MFEWMHWTLETITTIGLLFIMLAIMAILDKTRKSSPRKGFLPMATTLGDRIFLSLVFSIIAGLVCLKFYEINYTFLVVMAVIFVITLKFG